MKAMQVPVYLDYAATTPVDPRVADAMIPWLVERFGNPASTSHAYGRAAEAAVTQAREAIAALVGCRAAELVFTSGATESINLALKGAAHFHAGKGRHLVSVATEHKATLDTMRELAREGFAVTLLDVGAGGLLDPARVLAALRPETTLVSVMHVNNETGVIQDIAAIGALCRERGVVFHVDAAQATGKVAIDLATLPVDLMSFSAHKTYGPKGVGALYVRRTPRARIEAQMHGGGHERGLRSGTLPTHQIAGMGEAYRIANGEMEADNARIRALRDRLWAGLRDLDEVYANGDLVQRIPHNLNVSFGHVDGERLLPALAGIAVSSGAACTSAALEPSYVLRALGRSDALAHASIRFTIGRFTTDGEIDHAIGHVREQVTKLRKISAHARMRGEAVDVENAPWLTAAQRVVAPADHR